jgi:hypothetical protein
MEAPDGIDAYLQGFKDLGQGLFKGEEPEPLGLKHQQFHTSA